MDIKKNLPAKQNNQLRKVGKFLKITNKLLSKSLINQEKLDWEWWSTLNNEWKTAFLFHIKKPNSIMIDNIDYLDLKEILNLKIFKFELFQSGQMGFSSLYKVNDCDSHFLSAPLTNLEPLARLSNLEVLVLTSCYIINISPLRVLVNLKELNIKSNSIEDINPLKNLINLKKINIGYNEIKDISSLQGLVNLLKLNLNGNKIENTIYLTKLINLCELELVGTGITNITGFESLINLFKLDLMHNNISCIKSLESLDNLKALRINGNNLQNQEQLKLFKYNKEGDSFMYKINKN